MMKELNIKPGTLVNRIRTVLTGRSVDPEFLDVLLVLGKQTVVSRLRSVGTYFED